MGCFFSFSELLLLSRRKHFWGLLGVTGGAHSVRLLGCAGGNAFCINPATQAFPPSHLGIVCKQPLLSICRRLTQLRRLFLLLARHSMLAPSALASCVGSAFCILHFAFCILHFAFCILHFAFCILHFAFCILHSAFCILSAIPLCRPHRWH